MMFLLFTSLFLYGDGHFEYVGSKKCMTCHKKEERGDQAGAWQETAHANALQKLHTEQARIWAEERGFKTPPYETPACVKCHVVGFESGGFELKDSTFWNPKKGDKKGAKAVARMEQLKNVGCEACHGPGGSYKSRKKMEAIFKGEIDGASLGLQEVTEKTCVTCHNPASPAFKEPFNFEESLKKISHAYPPGMREQILEELKK